MFNPYVLARAVQMVWFLVGFYAVSKPLLWVLERGKHKEEGPEQQDAQE